MALAPRTGDKMSVIQMAQRIKQVHPDYVSIYKIGAFCNTFGKDSYIISSIFDYSIKSVGNISSCGFSKKCINRVISKLEDMKINYLVIDPRNNYDVEEKCDNKNLNTYNLEFEKASIIIKQRNQINKIKQQLEEYIGKEDFKTVVRKVNDVLNEK